MAIAGTAGANDGDAVLAGKMGEASTLEALRSDGPTELVEASVDATSCGVDTVDVVVVGTTELDVAGESDVGEAVNTSGTADGKT